MPKKTVCPNHSDRKATRICMGCGTAFCNECLTFVRNVPYCPNCQEVAEGLQEALQATGGDDYSETGEASATPKYVVTSEDARWESGFDSSQMVKISRARLAELERPMPLQDVHAPAWKRAIAHILDMVIILFLAGIPFYLEDWLARYLPFDSDKRFLLLVFHAFLALFYYRLPCAWFGGMTLGRVMVGIRLVDHTGKYIHIIQGFVHTILQAVFDITLLFIVNGLIAAVSKDRRSLLDRILGTRVVRDDAWKRIARKQVYLEDVSRLSS